MAVNHTGKTCKEAHPQMTHASWAKFNKKSSVEDVYKNLKGGAKTVYKGTKREIKSGLKKLYNRMKMDNSQKDYNHGGRYSQHD
tara:strand:- start:262 stop:513 length:252 start_codon:yes stop_codon:yes gene_type:complete